MNWIFIIDYKLFYQERPFAEYSSPCLVEADTYKEGRALALDIAQDTARYLNVTLGLDTYFNIKYLASE